MKRQGNPGGRENLIHTSSFLLGNRMILLPTVSSYFMDRSIYRLLLQQFIQYSRGVLYVGMMLAKRSKKHKLLLNWPRIPRKCRRFCAKPCCNHMSQAQSRYARMPLHLHGESIRTINCDGCPALKRSRKHTLKQVQNGKYLHSC